MHQPRHLRLRRLAISVIASSTSLVVLATTPVTASEPAGSSTSTSSPAEDLDPPILYGTTTVSGASVTTPGEATRTLDANQMTAFVQTWLAYSVYNDVPNEAPPDGVPVSRLAAQMIDAVSAVDTVFLYATDGTTVWVGANTGPGGEEKWIVAPDPEQTTKAFEGDLQPLRDPVSPSTTAESTATTTPATSSDDGGSGAVAAAGAGAALLAVIAAAFAVRARRRRSPTAD